MTMHLGDVPAGITLYIPFASYDGATGASEAISGLAVTDIEIYKNGSVTQRASDAGYALLDTDGIDFDGITGINGISVDLADNTDAGFYSVGGVYWVVVSSVTADAQTVNFIAATFRIKVAENTSGTPVVDVGRISNDATAADNAEAFFDGTGYAGTNNVIPTVTTLTNLPSIPNNWLTAAGINAGAFTSAKFAAGAIDAAALASDAVTEIQTGLSTLDAAAVNAEVVDALNTDTYAEPGQGNPAATTTLVQKIGFLYKAWRNKSTQTASEYALYADDGATKDQEAAVSDDATTFTRNEVQTGA
jgi:hypothetical protein